MAPPKPGGRKVKSSGGNGDPPDDDAAKGRAIGDRFCSNIDRRLVPVLRRSAWKRLRSSIDAFRKEVDGRSKISKKFERAKSGIKVALDSAAKAVDDGDIDGGWKHLQTAQRLALLATGGPELKAIAIAMLAEADKLNAWRKKAVVDLLADPESVARVKDEFDQNLQH